MKKLAYFLSTGFFSGLCPRIPGTAGSLVALGLAVTTSLLFPDRASLLLLTIAVTLFAAGVPLSSYAARHIFGHEDPPQIVIDEFAGMFLSVCAVPFKPAAREIALYTGAFILFRLLDILKPPGIKQLQRLKGGWGIMIDDIAAGALTLAAVILAHSFLLP